jgi:hypothetical protein
MTRKHSYTVRLALPDKGVVITRTSVVATDEADAAEQAIAATEQEYGETGYVLDGPVEAEWADPKHRVRNATATAVRRLTYYRAQRGWTGRKFEAASDEEAWAKAEKMLPRRSGVPLVLHRAGDGDWERVGKR